MTIQSQIHLVAAMFPPGYPMHISDLQALSHSKYRLDMPYSYKQVRDALFRLSRGGSMVKHVGRGWYEWDVQ